MLNKKGEEFGRSILWAVVYSVSFLIIIIFLKLLIGGHLESQNNIKNSVFSTIADRVIYSKECVAYSDGYRVYPGVVDLSLFYENRLKNCIGISEAKNAGAIIDLRYADSSVASIVKVNPIIADLYFACKVKDKDFKCVTKRQNVIIYDNGKLSDGYIDFFVVVQNG